MSDGGEDVMPAALALAADAAMLEAVARILEAVRGTGDPEPLVLLARGLRDLADVCDAAAAEQRE